MEKIMGHLKRYWKQIAGIGIFAVASVVAFTVGFAAQVTVSMYSMATDPVTVSEWTQGHEEMWHADITGVDSPDVQYIKWTSSDSNVVMITNNSNPDTCTLRAMGAGTATISVDYDDGAGNVGHYELKFTVKLEITNNNIPDGFHYFSGTDDTFTINTNFASNAQSLQWESDNEEVATVVSDGARQAIVTAGSKGGSALITGTTPQKDQKVTLLVIRKTEFNQPDEIIQIGPNDYYNVFIDEETGMASTNAYSIDDVCIVSEDDNYILSDGTGYIKGVNAGIKSVFIYPNIDYSSSPTYANATPAQLAGAFGDSKSVRISFGISNGDLTAAVGDTVNLRVNTTEEDARGVNWTSDNTNVATVDSQGKVTMVGSGVAKIKATLYSESLFPGERNHEDTITITVVDTFALDSASKIINAGDTFELTALVTDNEAKVSWMSSDESIVSFTESEDNSFKVTVQGNKKGVATITAVQEVNGVLKYAYCEVNVNEPVQNVTLYPTELNITQGDLYPLVLTFEPDRPDNMEVKWVSSDESVATVSDTGVVTGVGGGDAVISVITMDGVKVASCDVHVRVPVTGITLSMTYVETNLSAKNYQLSYTIFPEGDGVDRTVVWSSSNEQVLTVDQNGFVTFVSPGKATVICQTNDIGTDGNNLIATCEFFIYEPVTSVSIDFTDVTMRIGEKFRLTAEVLPTNATDKSVTWISSNTSVVTVDENGMLTAVGSGSAAVLVQSNDSGVTAMCNVSVYQPVETVTISHTEMTVRKGTVFWLYAEAGPENAVNKTILWTTSDPTIATVDETGMVTALMPGECTITATSQDTGVYATCKVTVTEPVTGITLNFTEASIYAGDRIVIIPSVTPIDADNKAVTYLSSDPEIASVDENGIVTGLKGGSCVILVTTVERGLVASCKITVYEFVTSVTINEKDVKYINNGASKAFTVTVTPDSASNRGVIWSSSNTNVMRVSQKGVVTAVGVGTATITATAADGSGIFDTVVLTSIIPVSTIQVSPSYVTVIEGQSAQVTATVQPGNASIKDIDWSSSDTSVAVVDYNGEITGVSAGICYVYAKSTDGNEIVGTVKVTVKRAVPATSIVINSKEVTMFPGQTRALSVRLKPSNSTDNAQWVSSDTSVATVSSTGVVTARGQGNAVIYCIADSGVESECIVNVLALNSSSITLEQYDNYQLDVFGSTDTIVWYTNNNRVATVDANGKVIARGVGTTTITARVNGKLLYCRVTVTRLK